MERFATFYRVLLSVHLAGAGISVILAGFYIKSPPEVVLQDDQETQQCHNIEIVLHLSCESCQDKKFSYLLLRNMNINVDFRERRERRERRDRKYLI